MSADEPFLVPVADGVELCVESFGSPAHPVLLLVAGRPGVLRRRAGT